MLEELRRINKQLDALHTQSLEEDRVYRAELEERRILGLHGKDAIRHYNDFMLANGMMHLLVSEAE